MSYNDAAQAVGRSNRRRGECRGVALMLFPPNTFGGHEGNDEDAEPLMRIKGDVSALNPLSAKIVREIFDSYNTWGDQFKTDLLKLFKGTALVDGQPVYFYSPIQALMQFTPIRALQCFA